MNVVQAEYVRQPLPAQFDNEREWLPKLAVDFFDRPHAALSSQANGSDGVVKPSAKDAVIMERFTPSRSP
jgi:hypothetical protein